MTLVFLLFPCFSLCQTGITGSATITLVDAGSSCGGAGRFIEIYADVTGLNGSGGEAAGINSFVISLTLDRPGVFASALAGTDPNLHWGFLHTNKSLVQATGDLILTGWVPEPQAPNQNYHLATLIFAGDPGPVTLSMNSAALASRVVGGQNPESIGTTLPATLNISIPIGFNLSLPDGLPFWGQIGGSYDLENPPGINIQDFVSIVNCGGI